MAQNLYITAGSGISIVENTSASTIKINAAGTQFLRDLISNPQAYFAQRPEIILMHADAAIHVTYVEMASSVWGGTTFAGDLKYADDNVSNLFANSALIAVLDTANGHYVSNLYVAVPAGKFIYILMDSAPPAATKDFYFEMHYTYD